jgi:hypothetical protein
VATNRYLDAAEACIRLAEQTDDTSRKLKLLDMTLFWVKMAQETDGIGTPEEQETAVSFEPLLARSN